MNVNKLFYLKKVNIAKLLMVGCVFLFALLLNNINVNAKNLNNEITIDKSTYTGNGNSNNAVKITNSNGSVSYIQGTGVSNKDGIVFTIDNVYDDSLDNFTAFSVWESYYTSSEGPDADYDVWYLRKHNCTIDIDAQDGGYAACLELIGENKNVVKDGNGKVISSVMSGSGVLYYIEKDNYSSKENNANFDPDDEFVDTQVDFTKFFTNNQITYQYRIRSAGIGYKTIQINYWKANMGDELAETIDTVSINYGLARAIDDVDAWSNYYDSDNTTGIACSNYSDSICVDYVDSNGDNSKITITPATANVYLPTDILYEHKSLDRTVIEGKYVDANTGAITAENKEKMEEEIIQGNNLYSYNYFCESQTVGIVPAALSWDSDGVYTPSCSDGDLREYIYTGSTYKSEKTIQESAKFVLGTSDFMASTYQVAMTVDTKGNFVVIIRDMFGNTNNKAVIKVMDILNQSILTYFEKSNSIGTYDRIDGWQANEYLTKEIVNVRITMIATTIVKVGFPIVDAATTALTPEHVKEIGYWRVDSDFDNDICSDTEGGEGASCAVKPTGTDYTVLYSNGVTQDTAFGGFEDNTVTIYIKSNGRYRFYIEASTGNTETAKGENRNPRVEVYKIDRQAPEVYFGGIDNTNCNNGVCKYVEETYQYYQGTGSQAGSILDFTDYTDETKITYDADKGLYYVTYGNRIIYYVSADGKDSLKGSSVSSADAIQDIFFTHMHSLVNSKAYVTEVISPYGANDIPYAYYYAKSLIESEREYVTDSNQQLYKIINGTYASEDLREEAYRNYIIKNNVEYTAFSLAINPVMIANNVVTEEEAITVELYDAANSNTKICDALGSFKMDLNGDNKIDQYDCANYYLDHGVDFVIKITSYDIVQEKLEDGTLKYIRGNGSTKSITVDVQDTTAPGFNEEIVSYNIGTNCRIEIGNTIGISGQNINNLLECYNVTTSDGNSVSYNFEDNVFSGAEEGSHTLTNVVNNINHVSLYILSRETGKWIALNSGTSGYIPNRSGNYALLVVIRDNAKDSANRTSTFNLANKTYFSGTWNEVTSTENLTVDGNAIATVVNYYVDKRIVLVTPEEGVKDYGDADPLFTYCIAVNKNNSNVAAYLKAPFSNMDVFSDVGCATEDEGNVSLTDSELEDIFKGNKGKVDFNGKLTRQESAIYNAKHYGDVSNDYVGLYKIVLGTLNIVGEDTDGYDLGEDYIIKINPNVRNSENQLVDSDKNRNNKCNLVDSQIVNGDPITGCYSYTDDDDFFVESIVEFTIRQVIITVTGNGSEKNYGSEDTNYGAYSQDNVTDSDGYLNGFTVEGFKNEGYYSDSRNVVLGVLRREVGEDVGVYAICNYRGDAINDNALENGNNMLIVGKSSSATAVTCGSLDNKIVLIPETLTYKDGIIEIDEEFIKSRALYIETNKVDGYTKTLNTTTDTRNNNYANYLISYIESIFTIKPVELIIQPTPGQRREYSYNGVDEVNPWEVVIYNEKTFSVAESGFNGFTDNSSTYTANANDAQSIDTPETNSYDSPHYNNASEVRDTWTLIRNGVTYENGYKTNETYTLLTGRLALVKDGSNIWVADGGLFKNMRAGWYNFASIKEGGSTLQIATTERSQCSYSNYKTSVGVANDGSCRNYDIVLDLDYRDLDGDTKKDANGTPVDMVYKSKLGYCMTTELGEVSDVDLQCSRAQSKEILFEVYRREIILEFNSLLEKITVDGNDVDFVYGYRYEFYENNLFTINASNTDSVEDSVFYCYATYTDGLTGVTGDCTSNPNYGLTAGDKWSNIGLEFHLHSLVQSTYYDSDDKAIPAGRYYVYSSISDDAKNNYKYNYLGGTLTIKTKAVTVDINEYNKEYGNVYYGNVTCLNDGSFLNGTGLINIASCDDYGFVIDNNDLDSKDSIKDNFDGRPLRDTTIDTSNDRNGLQDNVGIYPIRKGSIVSKHHGLFSDKACEDNFKADENNCVIVEGVNINNYMVENDPIVELTYYLLKNGTEENEKDYSSAANDSIVNDDKLITLEGTLTITSAEITITVTSGQTKMYGCAYNAVDTTGVYYYSYENGYEGCVSGTGINYDLGYGYTVVGDKDFYIYNNGYYESNYDSSWENASYYSSKINDVVENGVASTLFWNGSKNAGLRSGALNGGVLYRISTSKYSNNISYSSLISAADNAQAGTHYQGQSVGSYIITLGNLSASGNLSNANDIYNKLCDANNVPGQGTESCKNYIVNYHGNTSISETHEYETDSGAATTFTITPRIAFISSKYNSKVYGNDDPVIENYGLTIYTVKENSLAVAPWVSEIDNDETGISFETISESDTHSKIVIGEVTRFNKGANNGKDDDVGIYQYDFSGVTKTEYADKNYDLNFYYRELNASDQIEISKGIISSSNSLILTDDGKNQTQAVNEEGGITETVGNRIKPVAFEITLRKITVSLISFSKVYGIQDHEDYYDLGVCATGDERLVFDDEGNPKCELVDEDKPTDHGLSPTHAQNYVNNDGTLKQSDFKTAFNVYFLRMLGENVACTSFSVDNNNALSVQEGTINGFFPPEDEDEIYHSTYNYNLGCNSNGYEALAILPQTSTDLAKNYEITYVEGIMNILPRNIEVTPDSNQGFQYGSYTYPSLIPAISFTNKLIEDTYASSTKKVITYRFDGEDTKVVKINRNHSVDNPSIEETEQTIDKIGLVNKGNETGNVCLLNIDKTNTFCINDRQDTYEDASEITTSRYSYNYSGEDEELLVTYVFGDEYSSESSSRHALNRVLGVNANQRYNRNVGEYTIVAGDLVDANGNDLTGNYKVMVTEGVKYKITPAQVTVTPDSDQGRTYGYADKELTFTVVTTYTVNRNQYVVFSDNIVKIVNSAGFEENLTPTNGKILVGKDSTITLNGYAYYENDSKANYNYGVIKNSNKSEAVTPSWNQLEEVKGKSFDNYCYNNYTDNSIGVVGNIAGCSGEDDDQSLYLEKTTRVLVGYLYVTNYNQHAGNHEIVSGFHVSSNEFNQYNYELTVISGVTFKIDPREINLYIKDVNKEYGKSTDAYKCDLGVTCNDYANLEAQDNEGKLEYNFDVSLLNSSDILQSQIYEGEERVLLVGDVNGKYYTTSKKPEDKNGYLGIRVARINGACTIDSDVYGCEDAGTYALVLIWESINAEADQNYILMIGNKEIIKNEFTVSDYVLIDPAQVDANNRSVKDNDVTAARLVTMDESVSSEDYRDSATLTITKKSVDIYVNTNLSGSDVNYYEIEQNVEVPSLPSIYNEYNLSGYRLDVNKQYHGYGENAMSTSDNNATLPSTYTRVVWGGQPSQVRTSDALVGQLAYCNEANSGNDYPGSYPNASFECDSSKLVYQANKNIVNTNTSDKFIVITRDSGSNIGLKIRGKDNGSVSNIEGNIYEETNYNVTFYPGAVHVVGDEKDPVLNVGVKDYYLEANASKDGNNIIGKLPSSEAKLILEYLLNGSDKYYILAGVNSDGNLYITVDNGDIVITKASLEANYGSASAGFEGVVSGVEKTSLYPFVSDYAHVESGNGTYLDEVNITTLQELVTTLIKWFGVESYDSGQYLNGEYLPRKFDKYYYIAINKTGYDIANDINNEFAVNKVGTYNISFYVMDNAGKISGDDNVGRLHIIDTTTPQSGELTLYNGLVKCDEYCNDKEKWYIAANKIRLASFNKYSYDEENSKYYLDNGGEYIKLYLIDTVLDENAKYVKLDNLPTGVTISNESYIDYISFGGNKYSAEGIEHYGWNGIPDGIQLTITGGEDNSYYSSSDSQWKYYYSLDGSYWFDYIVKDNMTSYTALLSDGIRTIYSSMTDSGVKLIDANNVRYDIGYKACYGDCLEAIMINSVDIDGRTYTFTESEVTRKTFNYDSNTVCSINIIETLVTCIYTNPNYPDQVTTTIHKLEGNKFSYNGSNYVIVGNNVFATSVDGDVHTKLIDHSVTLGGVKYRFDKMSMTLYRDYEMIVVSTVVDKDQDGKVIRTYTELDLNGIKYELEATVSGTTISGDNQTVTVNNDGTFALNVDGKVLNFVPGDDALYGRYYVATLSYKVYQESFKVGANTYNISQFTNGEMKLGGNTLYLKSESTYFNSYTLYDSHLSGLVNSYSESSDDILDSITHRASYISNVAWLTAARDNGETISDDVKSEINMYLNGKDDADIDYYTDQKVGYLDTKVPLIGNVMTSVVNGETQYVYYGREWYIYEHGYYNSMAISDKEYILRGITYTVSDDNTKVTTSDSKEYDLEVTNLGDDSRYYVYEREYVNYYIDKDITNVKWLYAYIDEYVGVKDLTDTSNIRSEEIKPFSLSASVVLGDLDDNTHTQTNLLKDKTDKTVTSGIGETKYLNQGWENELRDYMRGTQGYGNGVYYQDIDYVVLYDDNGTTRKVNLKDSLKACYASEGMITQDCLQKAISQVVVAPSDKSKDITYTINYIVRDKAGNASAFAAKGVIYASIRANTNVIVNPVELSAQNSGVSVASLGNNTYSMEANQGVSLELLDEAFSVNYKSRLNNYNSAAVMTIYKEDELLFENVSGVAFTNYINSDEIADYTIIYNLNTEYKGEEITGETITLKLSISSPNIYTEDNDIKVENVIKNESNSMLFVILIGFMLMIGVGVIFLVKRR